MRKIFCAKFRIESKSSGDFDTHVQVIIATFYRAIAHFYVENAYKHAGYKQLVNHAEKFKMSWLRPRRNGGKVSENSAVYALK